MKRLLCTLLLAPLLALAQSYPAKPVRLIVPFPPGGTTDLIARVIQAKFQEFLGQQVLIENRPGAAGIIGTAEAAKAAADGYTLLVVASPHVNLEILATNKPYVLMRDFAAVGMISSTDAVLVVHPSVPAKSVTELVALAKSKPGALTY